MKFPIVRLHGKNYTFFYPYFVFFVTDYCVCFCLDVWIVVCKLSEDQCLYAGYQAVLADTSHVSYKLTPMKITSVTISKFYTESVYRMFPVDYAK